ncbi:mitochondrial carrier protein domain-containing protein [Theileria equi strain WA]|uniref:Mitochondrial carrier protein domain-containing protein n=1 Tax=Theileria equi strain WA TaxID=1537102 RepID=L0B2G8_THEEQ|nr:mitochondrial carrier protein domain-containing protein [Theileria equi strain WA]AFZ81314.1 mitochondrial carrier protein domain-containing protein [Theileria equi strain WA]|eukprot:XP_004830980.1 mitochondrial carrier protein domain-containing protein [Theileria equi strain WA]
MDERDRILDPSSDKNRKLSKHETIEGLKKRPEITAISNAIAAGLTNAIIQPMAVLRTRIQSMNIYDHGIKSRQNLIVSILKSCKKDGILSLYKGSLCSVYTSAFGWLAFRFIYDKAGHLQVFKDHDDTKHNLIRGGASSFITSLMLHPLWNAKLAIELQSSQTKIDGWPQYRGAFHYLFYTYKAGGLRAIFTGLPVSLSSVSHHTLLIVIYERLSKCNWSSQPLLAPFESFQPFFNGMASRIVPTALCYPLYVSRTMQQCHGTEITKSSISRIMFWNAHKNKVKGMYAGFQVQIVRSMLSGGIMFALYEGILTNIGRIVYLYNN